MHLANRSLERLQHFQCGHDDCKGWWSIGDAPEYPPAGEWYCPWCGRAQANPVKADTWIPSLYPAVEDRMTRYLTACAKLKELEYWAEAKNSALPSEGRTEDGFADLEIIPTCDMLNEIEGVCTLQSCAGHAGGQHPPTLWLWLSEEMSARFDLWGSVLARMPGIESVSRKYQPWGQEIVDINMDGRHEVHKESLSVFFGALSQSKESMLIDT